MSDRSFVMLAAAYDATDGARTDFEMIKAIKADGNLHRVTAAMVHRSHGGRFRVHETTHSGKVATVLGFVGGAMLGAVAHIPGVHAAAAIAVGAIVLAVIFGLVGHFAGGIPRRGLRAVAAQLEDGEAAIVVTALGDARKDVSACLVHATTHAHQTIEHVDMTVVMAELVRRIFTPGEGDPVVKSPRRRRATDAPPPPWADQQI